ncbi:hypothetical protein EH223_03985 [candidate division KSB1 bacterium]|nr:hypothetical protein [candidate division KSB1 bacterium]RQW05756.1 MAG: hypothetical protein EH223_03985 [candidate division KSB1 bacterium]
MKRSIILLIVILVPVWLGAQFKTQTKPVDFADRLKTDQQSLGIIGIDMSRFSMSHSYSMSYMSVGGRGFTQGLYLNTMSYQFSIPLTVSLQLGMAHNPFQGNQTASILQNGFFLSGAQIRYKPSAKTTIQLDFRQMPYQYTPGLYYMSRPGFSWFDD